MKVLCHSSLQIGNCFSSKVCALPELATVWATMFYLVFRRFLKVVKKCNN